MSHSSAPTPVRPGAIGRVRSRQAGLPTGTLGRIIGRVMVKDTAEANDRAIAALNLTAPITVLEIGFGQGRTVQHLVAAGHTVLGVDASATMVRQATARNRRATTAAQATLRLGDGSTLPFDSNAADAALCVHTIYFLPDLAATLHELARVLRSHGQLVLACRLADDPMPAWMDPTVYSIPTYAALQHLLDDAGFELIDHQPGTTSNHATHVLLFRRTRSNDHSTTRDPSSFW